MKYFSSEFIEFFKDLARNNNTEWFHENKKRYEDSVKIPFAQFIDDVIIQIKKMDKSIQITSKEAIMRINRDIRFSKDKSPYNIHMSAIISKYGKKGKEYPGMYLQFTPEKIMIYSGAYMIDKDTLLKIRKNLAKNGPALDKVINAAAFKNKFGKVLGEKNKVIPSALKSAAEKQPLIYHKNFYIYAELPAKEITSDKLLQTIVDYYKTAKPFNDFFAVSFGKK